MGTKKKAATRASRSTRKSTRKSAKKSTTKRASKKRGTARKSVTKHTRPRRSIDLRTASPDEQADVFAALQAALERAGVMDNLIRIEVAPRPTTMKAARKAIAKATAKAGARARPICPPGFVLRMVCALHDGVVVCDERCVPR